MKPKHTAIIADDHALVRTGLKQMLEQIDAVELVAEAADGLEAIALSKLHKPSLLTLDSGMPLASGREAYGEIRRWSPQTKIVLVTGFTASGQLRAWLDAGIDGLFLKSCPADELKTGIEEILRDKSPYLSAAVHSILADKGSTNPLSQRELQILHMLAEGHSNQTIGERLSISTKTVDNHRTRLMSKLDVHSLGQLIAFAIKEGYLDTQSQL